MLREIYMLLKQRLELEVDGLKHIDWNLQQLNQDGDDFVPITPSTYIAFQPIEWDNRRSSQIQSGILTFDITLVNDSAYGTDEDMIDTNYINHLAMEADIYKAVQGWRGRISMLPEFSALSGTPQDVWLLETIVRTTSYPHNLLGRIQTTQTFQSKIFDYNNLPVYQQVLAELNLTC